jgi:hypothetical protein
MIARLQRDYAEFESLAEEYDKEGTTDSRQTAIVSRLDQLAEESHTEGFTRLVREQLGSWGE